jgi:peptidoglycan/LPS O-acetylase OafA/YrhL
LSSIIFIHALYRFSEHFVPNLHIIHSLYFSSFYMCSFIFLLLISRNNFFKSIFEESYVLKKGAKYSFGTFLFHPMCMLVKTYYFDKLADRKPPVSNLEIAFATLILSYICGWLFYHLVQTPFTKIGDFVNHKIKKIIFKMN